MEILFNIYTFTFGAIVGSFLNVVICRYGTKESVVAGRSMCVSCKSKLKWYELIPIASILIQKGKCRNCKAKISMQYPIVEALTGTLFFLVLSQGYSPLVSVTLLFIMSILVVIAVYDFWHKIIPDLFVFSFIALSFFLLVWSQEINSFKIPNMADTLAGPILFLPFAGLWYFSDGRWMGFGDAKLAFGIGWFLGLSGGASAIILAFWFGAIFGLAVISLGKLLKNNKLPLILSLRMFTITMKSEIPFGPFMILGTFLVFFFNSNVLVIFPYLF